MGWSRSPLAAPGSHLRNRPSTPGRYTERVMTVPCVRAILRERCPAAATPGCRQRPCTSSSVTHGFSSTCSASCRGWAVPRPMLVRMSSRSRCPMPQARSKRAERWSSTLRCGRGGSSSRTLRPISRRATTAGVRASLSKGVSRGSAGLLFGPGDLRACAARHARAARRTLDLPNPGQANASARKETDEPTCFLA